jgi:cell fate regulator YaaT (PSP1 superfamily)
MTPNSHLVRVGLFGHVGRFVSSLGERVERGRRVVCRTRRGLEVGVVLSEPAGDAPAGVPDGALLRRVTPEDDLLLARLERDRHRAFERCARLVQQRGLPVTLVDVEHLFDGRSLFFYFLGEVTPEVDALTRELAETYEATVQFRQFADALQRGCGPDCGTHEATGCGSGCTSCAVASACHDR